MAFDAHKNFAVSTVATAPSPATSGTSLVVAASDGAKFPAVPFNAVIWPTATNATAANAEVVRVTGISTDTLTITRAQESSVARTVIVGDQIAACLTAKSLTDIETKVWPETLGGTNQSSFTTGDILYASAANTLSKLPIGTSGQQLQVSSGIPAWVSASAIGLGVFGDGSDGALTYDGSTTILGMAPASNVYTLTRDIYPTTMVVNNGVTVKTNGFCIFAQTSVTTNATGIISNNGNNASGVTGGLAGGIGTVGRGVAGPNGRTTTGNGANSSTPTVSIGAVSGAGGTDGVSGVGGSGITPTVPTAAQGLPRASLSGLTNARGSSTTSVFTGGAGGGGGALLLTTGAPTSGGGGGGGNIVFISAKSIVNNGTLSANGGTGGDAALNGGTGSGGGGGGGGGGGVICLYNTFSGNTPTATGGAGGAPASIGTAGASGSAGQVFLLQN